VTGRTSWQAGAFLLLSIGAPAIGEAQSATPALAPIEWVSSPLDLGGPSRPASYVAAVGRRAVAMGTERGGIEVWTWPLKLLHGFELRFQTQLGAEPIAASTLAQRVDLTPAGVVITYTHPAFTVRQQLFAPLDEPAVVMVLDVDAVRPLELLAEFQSDLQFAWPGAVGGQYVYWDDAEKSFILSESQQKLNGFVGSPFATSATNQPAHNVPDAPSQLRIALGDRSRAPMPRPGEPVGRLTPLHVRGIPIVMVGEVASRDSVRAIYRRVLAGIPALYAAHVAHSQAVVDSAMWVETPDHRFDTAVRWAALNLDQAMVCNPDLGCGLVAGYGPSESRGTRPGFAWFFGGDASINSLGMSAAGQYALARDGLEFFTKYQRADGKIPHEISQSAGRLRWFEDFPYAFYHADTTPYWIMAWGDYWRASGDTASIRRVWPFLRKAYEWSRSTVDDSTGLMLNSKGGLGAVEVGDLGVGVRSDIYLSSVWIEALDRIARMADAVEAGGQRGRRTGSQKSGSLAQEARALRVRALAALRDRFWLPERRMYAFALLEGSQVRPELTVWPSTALGFGLFDPDRGIDAATAQARATLVTDWGSRALAGESALFDPLHYNNGAVWPFCTGFTALGQYRYRNPVAGFAALNSIVTSGFTWGLGHNPEVMAGMMYEPLEAAVPHQFFGTSFILTVLARGMLGWDPDVPGKVVRLAPQLPTEWDGMAVHQAPAGKARFDIRLEHTAEEFRATIRRTTAGAGPDTLIFEPHLPLGAVVQSATVGASGTEGSCGRPEPTARDVQVSCRVALKADSTQFVIRYAPGYEVLLPPLQPRRGDPSRGLRLLDQRLDGETLVLTLEGPAGTTSTFAVRYGARQQVTVSFPAGGDPVDGYSRAVVRVGPRP
jgi:glycogen debranching enzyme